MGEVLIGGTASLLICIFLSPKFIEFLHAREFGQQIREEGPQEHHAKHQAWQCGDHQDQQRAVPMPHEPTSAGEGLLAVAYVAVFVVLIVTTFAGCHLGSWLAHEISF